MAPKWLCDMLVPITPYKGCVPRPPPRHQADTHARGKRPQRTAQVAFIWQHALTLGCLHGCRLSYAARWERLGLTLGSLITEVDSFTVDKQVRHWEGPATSS